MRIYMHNDPTATARIGWGALGFFFTAITARTLLADVHGISDLRTDHLMTIGAMVGAVAAGVWFGPMLRSAKLLTATGLALAFSAATTFCLIGSAGRGDELAYEQNADARKINEERARYLRDLTEAKARYQAAIDAETDECSSGDGAKCKAKRATTQQRRAEYETADELVRKAKPAARENGKLKRAAEVVAMIRGTDTASAERALSLLWPFLPPSICEILAIIFWHQALVPKRRRQRLPQPEPPGATLQTLPETVAQVAQPSRMGKQQVLAIVRSQETLPSQAELARMAGVNKGTISRWLREWQAAGVVSRTRDGKANVVTITDSRPALRIAAG